MGQPLRDGMQPCLYRNLVKDGKRKWKGTMMRLLAFDFPEDEQVLDIRDQYMFGRQILVCPVLEPMYVGEGSEKTGTEKKRRVYLPRGTRWYDYWTHVKYEGGQYVEAAAPLDRILLFVREGAVIPVTEPRECTADMEGKDITLEIYSGADGSFSLYEDAGDGYGYERGEYCITEITWQNDSRKVEWKSTGDISYRKGTINRQIIT